MRALLRDVLEQHGYTVTLASTGQEALASLRDREYPVVLTDLRMKGMQGIELLTQIKQSWADTNVILMTAFGSVETAIQAMKQGAYDYLMKPVKNDDLLRATERGFREALLRSEINRLRREVGKVLGAYGHGSGHVFNLGHGIHPGINPDHVAELVDSVHELSKKYH